MYLLTRQERLYREKMRGKYSPEAKWYAIMVHCGQERPVRDRILLDVPNEELAEALLPELKPRRTKDDKKHRAPKLLFPSYVFLRCRMTDETYMTITSYGEVFGILGRAFRIPTVIDDEEMAHLRGVLETCPIPVLGRPLGVGAGAVVTRGLMKGMRGRVIEVNARFVKIETRFSYFDGDTSIRVSIPRADLRVEDPDYPQASTGLDRNEKTGYKGAGMAYV